VAIASTNASSPAATDGGRGLRGRKAADAQGGDGAFSATGDHHIGVAVFDHTTRFTNAMQASGAGRDHRDVWPLEAKPYRHLSGHHVDDRGRYKKR
jgi:hypothetical protein